MSSRRRIHRIGGQGAAGGLNLKPVAATDRERHSGQCHRDHQGGKCRPQLPAGSCLAAGSPAGGVTAGGVTAGGVRPCCRRGQCRRGQVPAGSGLAFTGVTGGVRPCAGGVSRRGQQPAGSGLAGGRRGQAFTFTLSALAISRLTRDTDKPNSRAIAVILMAPAVWAW
jgi:hypothetical protein